MMKKIILIFTLSIFASCDSTNLPSGPMKQHVRLYEVDAWGTNPDIIEFTPKGHKHMTCLIAISGADEVGGFDCFPKNLPSDPHQQGEI